MVLQGLTIVFNWGVLSWVRFGTRTLPETSSYLVFDVAFRTRVTGEASQKALLKTSNSETIANMKDAKYFVKLE